MERKSNAEAYFSIIIMAFVNSGVYGVIYMRNSFYNVMQEALSLSHIQMGNAWTVYGIIAAISYLLGGWAADRFQPQKLIIISLVGVAATGLLLCTLPPYEILFIVYALFGVFAILTYYPVSVKMIAVLGERLGQGKAFGIYWTVNYFINIVTTGMGIWLVEKIAGDSRVLFQSAVFVFSSIAVIALILFLLFLRKDFPVSPPKKALPIKEVFSAFANKKVQLISLVVFTNYLVISSFSYFIPYMRNVLGMSQSDVLVVNMIKNELLGAAVTLTVGVIADKMGSALKLIQYASFIGMTLFGVMLGASFLSVNRMLIIIMLVIISAIFSGARGVMMVSISESGIPASMAGCAIGAVSFIGYLPDAFYYLAAGKIVDLWGKQGYEILFAMSAFFALLCSMLCLILTRKNQKGGEI